MLLSLARFLFAGLLFVLPLTLVKIVGPFRIYSLDLLMVPLVCVFAFVKLTNRHVRILYFGSVDKLMVVLFVTITLSFLCSNNIMRSVPNFLDWIRYLVLYAICRALFDSQIVKPKNMESILSWVGLILVTVGLVQVVTDSRFGLIGNYFGEGRAQGGNAKIGLNYVINRVSGTTSNPNIYVMWINLFFSFAIVQWLINKQYVRFYAGMLVGCVVVVSTLARGGTLAFFMFLVILFLIKLKQMINAKFLVISTVAAAIVIAATLTSLYVSKMKIEDLANALAGRVEQTADAKHAASAFGRVAQVMSGFEVLSQPKVFLVGTGARNFPQGIIIHNMWMRFLVEHGILAFFALIAFSFSCYKAIQSSSLDNTKRSSAWKIYLTSSLTPYLVVSSQVYHTAGSYHMFIPLITIMAFMASHKSTLTRSTITRCRR